MLPDPDFRTLGSFDLLLGANIFGSAVFGGQRYGPSGSPSAFKTHFSWILAGTVHNEMIDRKADNCYHSITLEETLKLFWETEDYSLQQPVLSLKEKAVIKQFKEAHSRDESRQFIVPFSVKSDATPLGELRSLAVKRFEFLEFSLRAKGRF